MAIFYQVPNYKPLKIASKILGTNQKYIYVKLTKCGSPFNTANNTQLFAPIALVVEVVLTAAKSFSMTNVN